MRLFSIAIGVLAGVLMTLRYPAGNLLASAIIILVIVAWINGLCGKEGFSSRFFGNLSLLVFLPILTCIILSKVGIILLILVIILATIAAYLEIKDRFRTDVPSRGRERRPLFPNIHSNQAEFENEDIRDRSEIQ